MNPADDRASARDSEEREDHYLVWREHFGDPYAAAVEAAGDEPWHRGDDDARHTRFMRRYIRPAAPEGLHRDPRPRTTATITYPQERLAA